MSSTSIASIPKQPSRRALFVPTPDSDHIDLLPVLALRLFGSDAVEVGVMEPRFEFIEFEIFSTPKAGDSAPASAPSFTVSKLFVVAIESINPTEFGSTLAAAAVPVPVAVKTEPVSENEEPHVDAGPGDPDQIPMIEA